jgi:hypothetical protein
MGLDCLLELGCSEDRQPCGAEDRDRGVPEELIAAPPDSARMR